MAESLGHDLDVYLGGEHERGGDVPQIVQPDRRQSALVDEPLEVVGQPTGVQRFAVLLREHAPAVLPALAPVRAFGVLLDAVRFEHLVGVLVEGDHPLSAVGLRGAFDDVPTVLNELRGDGQCSPAAVEVDPSLAARLAAAQAAEGDQVEQGVQAFLPFREEVEEGACLFGSPHHDRARLLAGPQPFLDVTLFPHEGFRALGRGEFDV